MGCPKESSGGGPTDPPEELKPTYDSIDKNIFQAKCVSCHRAGEDGERVSLAKQDLLNSPLELVIPGNPDESGLVIAVERTDEKRMPLAKEGYGPLSDKEKEAIRKWIEDGAN
jgi:mono/diheme cytochrome c family protein